MSKTAFDYVVEQMQDMAKADSTGAGGWEAIQDRASVLLQTRHLDYFMAATIEYLKLQPYPVIKGQLNGR